MDSITREHLDRFTGALPGVVYQFTVRGDGAWAFEYLSPTIASLSGVTREAALADTQVLLDCVLPEDRPRFMASLDAVLRTSQPWVEELRFRRKDGAIRWVRAQATPLREADGAVQWMGVVVDITQQKQLEQRQRWRSHVLELLDSGSPLATVLDALVRSMEQDHPGTLGSVLLLDSERKRLLTGAAPSLPAAYNAAIHGLEIDVGVGCCGPTAVTGEPVIAPDLAVHPCWEPYRHLAAEANLASCWSLPIRSSSGKVVGTFANYRRTPHAPTPEELGLLEDCARVAGIAIERARATETLRVQERAFRAFFEQSMVGLARTSPSKKWLDVNQALCATLGYPREELTGMTWAELTHPEDLAADEALFNQMMRGQLDGYTLDKRFRRKDGQPVETHLAARLVRRDDGEPDYVATLVEDISARKQAEADRLVLGKLESTGILAGGMAHDFNNLLTALIMNVELAQLSADAGEDVRPFLTDARGAANAAKNLTQQILTFARGGPSSRTVVDLTPIIREATAVALSGSSVRADISLAPDLWHTHVDTSQMDQVLRNLVLNAREALPHGGAVSVHGRNMVLGPDHAAGLPPGEYVQLGVADHGVGIPADVLPRVFDPYFSTKERGAQKGMGLGLTICHSVVHKHGGAILVDSSPGQGTSVQVYLPARRDLVPHPPPAAVSPTSASLRRVLLMDDEKFMRDVARRTIERMGCKVVVAEDGQAAVDLYAQALQDGQPFDVVVLDLTIRGGMGGLSAMQAIRTLDPHAKGLVMSGYSQDAALREPARHGFLGALVKPFDIGTLRQAIGRVLDL